MRGVVVTLSAIMLVMVAHITNLKLVEANELRLERIRNQIEFEKITRVSRLVMISYGQAQDINAWKVSAEKAWDVEIDISKKEFKVCEKHMCGTYKLIKIT